MSRKKYITAVETKLKSLVHSIRLEQGIYERSNEKVALEVLERVIERLERIIIDIPPE